eukprot:489921-Rhodomonas_salina.1
MVLPGAHHEELAARVFKRVRTPLAMLLGNAAVLRQCMLLRLPYAMPSTDITYEPLAGPIPLHEVRHATERCYAMSGTHIRYAPTRKCRSLPQVRPLLYGPTRSLRAPYAMSGTELGDIRY